MNRKQLTSLTVAAVVLISHAELRGEVVSFEIASRRPYADGRTFADRGAYEQWRGTVRFAVNPTADANRQIVDLDLAPRNSAGQVEFSADFEILAPTDLSKASGSLLYDVNNRGNRTCLGQFNGGGD